MAIAPTGKWEVHVSVRAGSADEDRFIELLDQFKSACLASQLVHTNPEQAWVRFGDIDGDDELAAFACADLELVNIVQRV